MQIFSSIFKFLSFYRREIEILPRKICFTYLVFLLFYSFIKHHLNASVRMTALKAAVYSYIVLCPWYDTSVSLSYNWDANKRWPPDEAPAGNCIVSFQMRPSISIYEGPSVRRSVGPSVRRLVRNAFVKIVKSIGKSLFVAFLYTYIACLSIHWSVCSIYRLSIILSIGLSIHPSIRL